jgi:hypothetical protein
MKRTSQAPPRCDPEKRDLRPSLFGEFLILMTAKAIRPRKAATAMKSCRKPRTAYVPMSGM